MKGTGMQNSRGNIRRYVLGDAAAQQTERKKDSGRREAASEGISSSVPPAVWYSERTRQACGDGVEENHEYTIHEPINAKVFISRR